jgi:hypothetical protein
VVVGRPGRHRPEPRREAAVWPAHERRPYSGGHGAASRRTGATGSSTAPIPSPRAPAPTSR